MNGAPADGARSAAHVAPGCKTVLLGNRNAPTGNNRKSRTTSGVITAAERSRVALTHPLAVFILLATATALSTANAELTTFKSAPGEVNVPLNALYPHSIMSRQLNQLIQFYSRSPLVVSIGERCSITNVLSFFIPGAPDSCGFHQRLSLKVL